ncbi:MerR family transcriptional regulator [Agreia sp. Leaf283]|uniref:MerR family transcriptional regulator n=1 Tax=Agreia sp. Leaf283 TaxID=1736321 RepID=UPI0006F32759|nr:MerR family transcriptional regulator [Agreia sp. Leaf283]KQP58039.1 MerR family transcriptional regulator [Agreia sp. Leaf283]
MSRAPRTDWSIQEIARLTGTTSRTLRHYGDIGLLPPTRVASNGYRRYDQPALVRLQRILLLRNLGLGLTAIARVLDEEPDAVGALTRHRDDLVHEKNRIDRQIASIDTTIRKMRRGEGLMAEEMLDGFAPEQHETEVSERWGAAAYSSGADWWNAKSADEKRAFQSAQAGIAADFVSAAAAGRPVESAEVQAIAERHVAWLSQVPGTPGYPNGPETDYLVGLGELYVADPRFATAYEAGGHDAARFVRDALAFYAENAARR